MIRPAMISDAPRVVEMSRKFLEASRYGELMPPAPLHLEAMFELARTHGVLLVHETEGWLGGFIALVGPLPHPVSGEPYAEEVAWWVEPDLRGLGIGDDLLLEAEKWGKTAGICVYKMIAPAGSSIGKLYDRHGYIATETVHVKRL